MKIKRNFVSIIMLLIIISSFGLVLGATEDPSYLKTTLLNQDPDPAQPGEYVELRFKVEKIGLGDLQDISFELTPEYPFTFDKTDSAIKSIGSWSGFADDDEQYILYYKLYVDSTAKEWSYETKLSVKSKSNGQFTTQTSKYNILVGEKKESSFVVGKLSISPLELVSDSSDNKLTIDIENIGNGNAEKVVADIELPQGMSPSFSYSDRSILGNIPANGNKQAEFYIDLDKTIKSGVHEATINLKYADESDEDNVYKQIKIPLEIPVHGQPQFEIIRTEFNPTTFSAGDSVQAHIIVKNVGEEEAVGVSLKTFKESSQPFDFTDKTDFIGKLEPGDEGEAVISFTVNNEAVIKEYILDAEIRGVYNEEVFVNDALIKVKVDESTKKTIKVSLIITILLATIGVIVGFVFGRKRK